MPIKQPHVGSRYLLDHITNVAPLDYPLRLHLFKNAVWVDSDVTLAALEECDFSGYAAQDIAGWQPAVVSGLRDRAWAMAAAFIHNGGAVANDVWGYFVTNQGDDKLLWFEKHQNGKYPMANLGDTYPVFPAYTQRSEE
jgi:hypothetical protein